MALRASFALTLVLIAGCRSAGAPAREISSHAPYVFILGIGQDGGDPQAGCRSDDCLRTALAPKHFVTSIAVVDPLSGERWLLEATPDLPRQLAILDRFTPVPAERQPFSGIFVTHAHAGHYAGLIHLGREIMSTRRVPLYALPRFADFVRTNGPWSLLVQLENIAIIRIAPDEPVRLNERIRVTPFLVPHRDEFSETAGFLIEGPSRRVLFIPDIDKWERWDRRVEDLIARADVALLDGTFFDAGELPGRNMSEIPHPFIAESLSRFASLPESERRKIRFIHLNHSNPALDPRSDASSKIRGAGMSVAEQLTRIGL